MTAPPEPDSPSPPAVPPPEHDWQPLPARGAWLAALGGAALFGVPLAIAGGVLGLALDRGLELVAGVAAAAAVGAGLGAWLGFRRHRRIRWRLDAQALALRREHWWHSETQVPISRVQHLDLRIGPLQRAAGLATLVVHTAGTRLNAVAVPGLDQADAERLRDRLARQLDHDDDAL